VYNDKISAQIDSELTLAEKARLEGFEGRARVCARRAAGIAIREYLQIQLIHVSSTNSYQLIQEFKDLSNLPEDLSRIADHLLTKVNEDFRLPEDIDLIAEVRQLVERLGAS
jgi:hypothetical protein